MLAQTNLQLYGQVADDWSVDDLARLARAYKLAADLFAGQYREGGKPFVDHLVGSASALLLDDASPELATACLLHAAYTVGDFSGRDPSSVVRDAVGPEVEALVAAYGEARWYPTLYEQARGHQVKVDDPVLAMRLANELDDWADGAMTVCDKKTERAEHHVDVALGIVELAHHYGRPVLADQLSQAIAACAKAPLPSALQARGRFGKYRSPKPRWRRAAGRVRRSVIGSWSPWG